MGPIWLADCLAGVMILTALYCCRRLVRSFPGSVAQRDVDVWHVVMGVVMAGSETSGRPCAPAAPAWRTLTAPSSSRKSHSGFGFAASANQ